MRIKVGIVEDNQNLARGLAEKLSLSEELSVSFVARNGKDLLAKLEKGPVPDVVLMDIEMDEMDGIAATREVRRIYPSVRVVMQTVFDDEGRLFEAIQAGATGYLLKDEKPGKIISAIMEVIAGGAPLSPRMARKALELLSRKSSEVAVQTDTQLLTKREAEILEDLQHGLRVKQIAEKLFIAEKTVRKHLEHIYEKLQVEDSRELLLRGRREV